MKYFVPLPLKKRLILFLFFLVLLALTSYDSFGPLQLFTCSSARFRPESTSVFHLNGSLAYDEISVNETKRKTQTSKPAECSFDKPIEADAVGKNEDVSIRVARWTTNARAFISCPELASSSSLVSSGKRVPNVLHRIWECDDIPTRYKSCLSTWETNSPNVVVLLWTANLRQEFISKFLGSSKLTLYNRLKPGSYRADVFKYIVMHYIGGIYSDLDANLLINLDSVNYLRESTVMAIDLNPKRLLPGAFLVAPPWQPVFVCAMGEVFDHSEARSYFGSDISGSLDISGPGVLGECVRHMLGRDDHKFRPGSEGLATMHFRLLHSYVNKSDGVHTIQLDDGVKLVTLQAGGQPYDRQVSPDCDPGEHYSKLYHMKEIYHPD